MDKNWKNLLSAKNQTVFSSYVHVCAKNQNTRFEYINDSGFEEVVNVLLLSQSGELISSHNDFRLNLGQALVVDIRKWLDEIGLDTFVGSVLVMHRHENPPEGLRPIRSMMSYWNSDNGFNTQVGSASYFGLNVKGKKEKQSFFMFCPSVVSTPDFKTIIAIFNHSTEVDYNDEVVLYPVLNDEDGRSIIGEPFKIAPFGLSVLDAEEHFGTNNIDKNKRYSITISHVGHVLGPLFFHTARSDNSIITGRHTQPAAGVFKPGPGFYSNLLRRHVPFLADIAISVKRKLKGGIELVKNIKETEMD